MQNPDFQLWTEITGSQRMADFLVESLYQAGAKYVFAMPAESLNSIIDAIRKHGKIRLVTVRHEGNGALMASAYSKLTGNLGVCMGTNGPGSTHLPMGAYDAKADGGTFIAISGQAPSSEVGTGGFQEIDSISLFQDCCRLNQLFVSSEQTALLADVCAKTIFYRTATHLCFAVDILKKKICAQHVVFGKQGLFPTLLQTPEDSKVICREISGKKTVLVVGRHGGVNNLARLSEKLSAPIVVLPEAIAAITTLGDCPFMRWSRHQANPCHKALKECEQILLVGEKQQNFRDLLANLQQNPGVWQLAPAQHIYQENFLDNCLIGDIEESIKNVLSGCEKNNLGFFDEFVDACKWKPEAKILDTLVSVLDQNIPEDAIISVEPGVIFDEIFFRFPIRRRTITSSFGFATPAYTFAGAMAASLAYPNKACYAIGTVGGMYVSMADFLSARKYGLPLKILCFEKAQEEMDIVEFASSCQLHAQASSPENFAEHLQKQLEHPLPSLISLKVPEIQTNHITSLPEASFVDNVCGIFHKLGAKRVYGRENTLWDCAFHKTGGKFLKITHCESAAMMASAYSKIEKSLGVCVIQDLRDIPLQLNGLYDAKHDGGSVLIVTPKNSNSLCQVSKLFADVALIHLELTYDRTSLQKLYQVLQHAIHIPCVVSVVVDWQILSSPKLEFTPQEIVISAVCVPDSASLQQAVTTLSGAKNPTILVGRGGEGAAEEIKEIASRLEAPIICTMPGSNIISLDHPHFAGRIGSSGHRSAFCAMENCDVLLLLGSSHRGAVFGFEGNFQIVQIDKNPLQLFKRTQKTLGLHGDTRQTLRLILETLSKSQKTSRQKFLQKYREQYLSWWQKVRSRKFSANKIIPPSAICPCIVNAIEKNPQPIAFTVDVGVTTLWAYRFFLHPARSIWTCSFATMGFSLPAAISLNDLHPHEKVFVIVGDGGIAVTMTELVTAVRENLSVVVVIFNNNKMAAIKFEQEVMGWPEYESYLFNGDFSGYAKACGAAGTRVTNLQQLQQSLDIALQHKGPYVIDVVCDPHEKPFPPKFRVANLRGYLFALLRELFLNIGTIGKKNRGHISIPTRYKDNEITKPSK